MKKHNDDELAIAWGNPHLLPRDSGTKGKKNVAKKKKKTKGGSGGKPAKASNPKKMSGHKPGCGCVGCKALRRKNPDDAPAGSKKRMGLMELATAAGVVYASKLGLQVVSSFAGNLLSQILPASVPGGLVLGALEGGLGFGARHFMQKSKTTAPYADAVFTGGLLAALEQNVDPLVLPKLPGIPTAALPTLGAHDSRRLRVGPGGRAVTVGAHDTRTLTAGTLSRGSQPTSLVRAAPQRSIQPRPSNFGRGMHGAVEPG